MSHQPLRETPRVVAPSFRWVSRLILSLEHSFQRAKAAGRAEEDTRVRIFLIRIVFGALFVALSAGAVNSALFRGEAPTFGVGSPGAVSRADLVDRNGHLLASNIEHHGLFIDPAEVWDRELAKTQLKRALPKLSDSRLQRVLYGDRRAMVMGGLTPQEKARVHALALGGISFEPEDRRVYPLGPSAAHVIGLTETGGKGLSGAEAAFDADIRAAGRMGEPFALSIDLRVQGVLENELRAAAVENAVKGAVGIVTNANTGEILALASYPEFDPNDRSASMDARMNRAAAAHYEMGSVFKSFTVAAGLDAGYADLATTFDASDPLKIGSRSIRDFHAQNRIMTLEEVFIHSSNIGTSRLAVEMGPAVMRRYFQNLGLLDATPVELKESAAPVTPRNWTDTTLASLSFGYGLMATPLQAVAATGALVNGGEFVPLSLRKGGQQGGRRRAVSAQTSATILQLMRANVIKGSGGRADAPGLRVGGKTGSANKLVNGRYSSVHALGSFAGVFPTDGPADTPRYVVFILMDEPANYPRTGGFVAAPAVGRVIDRSAGFLGVERAADRWRTATGEKIPQPEDLTEAAQ
ncbi:peptidoglycan D,D-transpeptidase FtsI family protein [Brevundimonas lutea]|uniref:peptidoglycan D,D-transpeptidase FtsI family protein n=1 Tax=Brevundimonas lutea TaxID=2293980 RepID=UPI000F01F95D|nr:penicillin-binding protein 2 [Brevundimonas lutea]